MDLVADFGSNPGNLGMFACIPRGAPRSPALVVALHGCNQTAREFDLATGWSALGKEHGFAVLFPEQKSLNNPHNCFNWFVEKHILPEEGEIASIRSMIEKLLHEHRLDPRRVFVTGLSAGGAMACALLASCPDLFAAGAIIGGLPYGAARGPADAMKTMIFGPSYSARELGDFVRRAAPGQRRWPKISIWHGDCDEVVAPVNGSALVRQWLNIHQLDEEDAEFDAADGQTRRVWRDASGEILVEHYAINGMAHGLPADGRAFGISGGLAAPFVAFDAKISSTVRIAKSWGLIKQPRSWNLPLQPLHLADSWFHFIQAWFTGGAEPK
ncbi:MAG: PHB depolymerase family esterase [Methylocapsa sp.]|nr:PHB depolymerase family esterase [Methylocapsa sp.]